MSGSMRCLVCLLIIVVGLFSPCSTTYSSGDYASIEVILTQGNQCNAVKLAVDAILPASIDISNHNIVVESEDGLCTSSKKKRNAVYAYDVYMEDTTSGGYDDDKTIEVRNFICSVCDAIKQVRL